MCQNWPLMSIKKIEVKKVSKKRKITAKVQNLPLEIEENYEVKIKFFNSKLRDRVIQIK